VSKSVKHYLSRLQPNTRPVTESILNNFFEWMAENGGEFKDFTPDQLLAYQKQNKNYEILDMIQAWIRDNDHLRAKTKQRYYSAVTSLFTHNRVFLPPDPSYKTPRADTPPVGNALNLDEIIRIIQASPPVYRAVITCMAQGFMGAHEVVYWSNHGYESLVQQLEEGVHPIKITLPGRKTNPKPFYTFVGRDAVNEIKRYFKQRPDTDEAIFLTRFKTPISEDTLRKYWNFKLKQLGIVTPRRGVEHPRAVRYGKSPHRIRHVMRSRWRLTGCDPEVCEFFMGHDLDQYGYDKSPELYPEWFEEQYLKAEPWLNILSEDPEKVNVRELHKLRQDYERRLAAMREEILAEVERQLEVVQRLKREL